MPDINSAFPSKYLKASDLGDAQPVLTIADVKFEEVGKDKDRRPILFFRGQTKGLVLNKTNATKITALLGTGITEEWAGQKIRLYTTETQFGGDTVECIRVKSATANGRPKLQMQKPADEPPPPSDDDFIGEDGEPVF